jgi:hypothetical protein
MDDLERPPRRAGPGGLHVRRLAALQFLALRDELAQDWQPRNGIERQLIDQMAQAQSWVYFWQGRLALRATVE